MIIIWEKLSFNYNKLEKSSNRYKQMQYQLFFEIHICLRYFPGKISICQKMPFENNAFA